MAIRNTLLLLCIVATFALAFAHRPPPPPPPPHPRHPFVVVSLRTPQNPLDKEAVLQCPATTCTEYLTPDRHALQNLPSDAINAGSVYVVVNHRSEKVFLVPALNTHQFAIVVRDGSHPREGFLGIAPRTERPSGDHPRLFELLMESDVKALGLVVVHAETRLVKVPPHAPEHPQEKRAPRSGHGPDRDGDEHEDEHGPDHRGPNPLGRFMGVWGVVCMVCVVGVVGVLAVQHWKKRRQTSENVPQNTFGYSRV
jgi:hypothetical protein